MNRAFIILTLLIFTLIPFTYAADNFAYNRLDSGKVSDLSDLDDVSITDPLAQQVILYNQSSGDWYNSYLNDSAHHVNASDYWITDIGSLSTVNATQFSNEAGVLTAVKSWWDGFYCELTGCTMQGDIDMDGNDIIDVGNLEVNENITARGTFIHFPNAGMLIGSEINESTLFAEEGDLIMQGNLVVNKSVNIINGEFQAGLSIFGFGAPSNAKFFFTGTGEYNNETREFCDYFNSPFDDSFEFNRLGGIFSTPVSIAFSSQIISVINSSCVIINTPTSGGRSLPSLSTVGYLTSDPLLLEVLDGGSFSSSVGNDPLAGFRINFLNATGEENFVINIDAGNDDIISSIIRADSNGFNNLINSFSLIESSNLTNGSIQINSVLSADMENHNDGEYTGLSLEILGEGNNVLKTGIDISSQFDTILRIAQEEVIGRAYYDDTTITQDITSELNDSITLTTLFEENGSIVYIGNIVNFTSVSFTISTESFNSIIPIFLFCNSSEGWEEFSPLDGTGGFTHSGTISFTNPTNRGVCNKEIDGTAFVDTIKHTYIAIQRTEEDIVINPTIREGNLLIKSSEIIYGNPEGVVGANRTFSISNEADLKEGEPSFLVSAKDSSGQRRINFALVSRQNESGGINYNSLGLFPDNDLSGQDKLNLTILTNLVDRWENYGINPLSDYFSQENRTSLAVLYGIESQRLFLHDDIGNGKLLGEGEFTWIAREGTLMEFFNGDGVHIKKDVIKEFGFSAGDNITSLNADFDSGTLLPFVQTTDGGANDWSLVSNVLCHSGECASAEGGSGSPIRSMQANFSSIDQDNLNLSWWLTTVQASPDVFSVQVNNNIGSGDVTVFTSSAVFVDEFQSVILPSSMDNKSIVTVIFNFQGNNPISDAVYVDEVLVVGNATTTTLANVTVEDGELNFGDETCGILLSAEDGYQDLNISCDNINLIGNVTSVDVTEVSINVTENVSIGDTIFVNNIRENTLDNGIIMWDDVGIGTSSPTVDLHVVAQNSRASILAERKGSNVAKMEMAAASNVGEIGTTSNDPVSFIINGVSKMYLDTDGNLGIGETNPTGKLHVKDLSSSSSLTKIGTYEGNHGSIFFYDDDRSTNDRVLMSVKNKVLVDDLTVFATSTDGNTYAHFGFFGDGKMIWGNGTDTWDSYMYRDGTNMLKIDGDGLGIIPASLTVTGRIGIGTDSPQNKLDISGAQVIGSSYAGVNTAPTDGLLVEGDVGIGTVSPGTKLEVNGNTTSDFYFLGNGAYIGYNATCQMITYNSTGGVMSTQGCI